MTGQLSALAQGKAAGTTGYTSKLLKTGQTTQYNSELDDGYYEAGVAKSYTINTTGAQSGTTNVDLAHYVGGAGAIAFNNTTHKITDSGNGLAIFKTGDVILTSSASNPGPFTVTTGNVAGEIVCSGATFTDETPAGAVTISKREAISNNTVLDNNTGLEWMRTISVKFGVASDGKMPWYNTIYDIFQWCAAVNLASVGGHNDWRVPNWRESLSIVNVAYGFLDSTTFPTNYSSGVYWTSSTQDGYNPSKHQIELGYPRLKSDNYAGNFLCFRLVRGGLS